MQPRKTGERNNNNTTTKLVKKTKSCKKVTLTTVIFGYKINNLISMGALICLLLICSHLQNYFIFFYFLPKWLLISSDSATYIIAISFVNFWKLVTFFCNRFVRIYTTHKKLRSDAFWGYASSKGCRFKSFAYFCKLFSA